MGQQSVRQAARKAALQDQSARRRERAQRDRRLEGLAVDVAVALRERDTAIADAERRAAAALRRMTLGEGLTLREAAGWWGSELTLREATRLRRLADTGERSAQQPARVTQDRRVGTARRETGDDPADLADRPAPAPIDHATGSGQ